MHNNRRRRRLSHCDRQRSDRRDIVGVSRPVEHQAIKKQTYAPVIAAFTECIVLGVRRRAAVSLLGKVYPPRGSTNLKFSTRHTTLSHSGFRARCANTGVPPNEVRSMDRGPDPRAERGTQTRCYTTVSLRRNRQRRAHFGHVLSLYHGVSSLCAVNARGNTVFLESRTRESFP